MNTLNANLICAIPLTRLGRSTRVPCICIQAFVHQCDGGEALINSSPTLSYSPPISLNTQAPKKIRCMELTTVQRGPTSGSPAFISLPQRLSRLNLTTHTHTHLHVAHQDTSFYYSYLFLPYATICTASHMLSGVFVFVGHLPLAPLS